jgi:hypothetical protein
LKKEEERRERRRRRRNIKKYMVDESSYHLPPPLSSSKKEEEIDDEINFIICLVGIWDVFVFSFQQNNILLHIYMWKRKKKGSIHHRVCFLS